jgi:hypothetical protein
MLGLILTLKLLLDGLLRLVKHSGLSALAINLICDEVDVVLFDASLLIHF